MPGRPAAMPSWSGALATAQISAPIDGRRAGVVYDPIGRAKPPAARHVCVIWRGIGGTPCDRGRNAVPTAALGCLRGWR